MNRKVICSLVAFAGSLLLTATNGFSFGSIGNAVNAACAPAVPYTGSCTLCHAADTATPTPAKDAALAGGATLTNFFCPSGPPPPTCTDNDGDTFAVEGGNCGPVDCNDSDPAINPNAVEICTDNLDNNCNNLVDTLDPAAVDCPLTCTDSDNDGYSIEGGTCGPVDCNDNDAGVNPGAAEVCGDTMDNDCDSNIDERCRLTCPQGSQLLIKAISWDRADRRKLLVKGRSFTRGQSAVGTTITIIDSETGATLIGPFPIKNQAGVWNAIIKGVSPTLKFITIISSNGCEQDERISRRIYRP